MKIAFFEINDWEKAFLKKSLKKYKLKFYPKPLANKNLAQIKDCQVICVFIHSKVTKELIDRLSELKLVTTRSTGFDHIDIKACQKNKITVCNVPYYGENTVAEHTFALLLSLSRKIHQAHLKVLRNDFSIKGLKGFDLKNKTIGIVGVGHIGQQTIKIAKGFGMKVLAYDNRPNKALSKKLGFSYSSFKNLLGQSDVISLHVPYNKQTHHLINKKNINFIKRGAVLINTARGGVIDTGAILKALDKKILAGVGLDVLENENLFTEKSGIPPRSKKLSKERALLKKKNVLFTPHIAFYSQEALERIIETTIQNIASFIANHPKNIVK